MKECRCCYREHNGRGWLCPQCNNPGVVDKGDGRNNNAKTIDALGQYERMADDGWFYDDEDDGERRLT